ncbi:MAG: hypothetical protein WCP98_13930, partial [Actinomycetes bacterium]
SSRAGSTDPLRSGRSSTELKSLPMASWSIASPYACGFFGHSHELPPAFPVTELPYLSDRAMGHHVR